MTRIPTYYQRISSEYRWYSNVNMLEYDTPRILMYYTCEYSVNIFLDRIFTLALLNRQYWRLNQLISYIHVKNQALFGIPW